MWHVNKTSKRIGNPPTCDVIHYDSSSRVSDVTWDEAPKSFLPRRVPQLQPDLWGRQGKGMGGKIKEEAKRRKKTRRDENKERKNEVRNEVSYGGKK